LTPAFTIAPVELAKLIDTVRLVLGQGLRL
jgi:hypothetical protein